MADDDRDGVTNPRDKCPGTPVGHPVDADGCSLLQRFANVKMWIEGAESIKPGQPAWYIAKGDQEFNALVGALTGAVLYHWEIDGKEQSYVRFLVERLEYDRPAPF